MTAERRKRAAVRRMSARSPVASERNGTATRYRLLLAGLTYTPIAAIRRFGLAGTDNAPPQCASIHLELLKSGAVTARVDAADLGPRVQTGESVDMSAPKYGLG